MWFPIIGWGIAGIMQGTRIHRAYLEICSQLELREYFPMDAWQSVGVVPALAANVARAIADRLVLPNNNFFPDDPLSLLLLDGDGMGFFEASYAIEKELGITIRWNEIPLTGNFLDLVVGVRGRTLAP